jgi:hypothetical protein
MKSRDSKSPRRGKVKKNGLDTFQPKIFRLKLEKNKSIMVRESAKHKSKSELMEMLLKYATNGNTPKNVLFIILRGTFKTRFLHHL